MKLGDTQIPVKKHHSTVQHNRLRPFDIEEDERAFIHCITDADCWQNFDKVWQQTTIEATKSFSCDNES